MTLPYELSARAERDIANACDWYDEQRPDLCDRFMEDLLATITTITERPTSCPTVLKDVRALLCDTFPYRVYFKIVNQRISILAVYHTARDPAQWASFDRE